MRISNSKHRIPQRVFIRYTFFQLPVLVVVIILLYCLQGYLHFSNLVKYAIILLWIIKDIIAFPFVWRSYDSKTTDTTHSMIGKQGIAEERLDPCGYVSIGSELWMAEVANTHLYIEKGEPVTVLHIDGLKLTVQGDHR